MPCDCPEARAANLGHRWVRCHAAPGCLSTIAMTPPCASWTRSRQWASVGIRLHVGKDALGHLDDASRAQCRTGPARMSSSDPTALLVEQANALPVAVPRLCQRAALIASCATWAVEKARHVARSAPWRLKQATAVAGTAQQATVMRGSAEHADGVATVGAVVASVRRIEPAGVLAPP